jgi:hypothetical protein
MGLVAHDLNPHAIIRTDPKAIIAFLVALSEPRLRHPEILSGRVGR